MNPRDVEKDFYAALGVPKTASQPEIKKAYRALARKLHPDANKDGSTEDKFKAVSEAYDVLSDPKSRAEYDEMRALYGDGGPRRFRPGAGGAPGGAGYRVDADDLFAGDSGGGFGDLLGSLFGGGGGGRGRGGSGPRRGSDVEADVTLSFTDAVNGVTVPLRLSTPARCGTCHGSGAAPGTSPRQCESCGGRGSIVRNQGGFGFSEPCRECRGAGTLVDNPCADCRGTGAVTRERTLTVRIPAGVAAGQKVRLAGKGTPGARGGPAGDLLVNVSVTRHPHFDRKADHLTVTLPLSMAEAALGAEVAVPTLDGPPVTLRVPAGTRSGRTFRVKGKGVPRRGGVGDLLVTVEVVVPTELSDAGRAALETLALEQPGRDLRTHLTDGAGSTRA